MKETLCIVAEPYNMHDGEIVCLYEGSEIQKEHGVPRMYFTQDGSRRYDNWDEWTLELDKEYPLLHLNPYSKPHKLQVITGANFCFIG